MREVSTRVWLDGELWEQLSNRAVAEGMTVRELIPRLVGQALVPGLQDSVGKSPVVAIAASPAPGLEAEPGPPVLVLSDVYRCAACGAAVKVGGLTIHMGKHMKELRASDAERS